jgi:hypothetical protein
MTSDEREPDTTETGGGRDVGQGYPEEQPEGGSPQGEGEERSGGDERAPDGAPDRDSDAGQATGNRDAAG